MAKGGRGEKNASHTKAPIKMGSAMTREINAVFITLIQQAIKGHNDGHARIAYVEPLVLAQAMPTFK